MQRPVSVASDLDETLVVKAHVHMTITLPNSFEGTSQERIAPTFSNLVLRTINTLNPCASACGRALPSVFVVCGRDLYISRNGLPIPTYVKP